MDLNDGDEQTFPSICGICGEKHFYRHCKYVVIVTSVLDKAVPTRAKLSLPEILEIRKFADQSYSVFTKSSIQMGTEFGPFFANKTLTLNPFTSFPLKIFTNNKTDLSEYYLDTTNENECCWMMFVNPASDVEEQNLICYQEGDHIFFGAIRDVKPGEPLKVWYSPYYASKMKKNTLSFRVSTNPNKKAELKVHNDLSKLVQQQQKIVFREIWNCKFCYKLEKDVIEFAKHLSIHYKLHGKKSCPICKQSFLYKTDYQKHIQIFHNRSIDESKSVKQSRQPTKKLDEHDNKITLAKKETSVGGPLLIHNILSDSFDNSNSLLQQTESNLLAIDNVENQNLLLEGENLNLSVDCILNQNVKEFDYLNDGAQEAIINENEKEQIICDICLKVFKNSKSIIEHLEFHMGKFFCPNCKKIYSRHENLQNHNCLKYPVSKCSKCDKLFYQRKYLQRHLKVVHEKRFACNKCHRSFPNRSLLTTHICPTVPENKRQKFKCTQCFKVFFKESYLKRHINLLHSRRDDEKSLNNVKKYICQECSLHFSTLTNYYRHMRLHQEPCFDCRICDKKFNRKDTLKDHIFYVHMLKKPQVYNCSVCKKSYKNRKLLNSHMTTHSNKRYDCQSCDAHYTQRYNLTRHLKQCQKNPPDFFEEKMVIYECPVCHAKLKLKNSLQRHVRIKHPEVYSNIQPELSAKKVTLDKELRKKSSKSKNKHNVIDTTDQKCMDLQKTIENMDFNIDVDTDNENIDTLFNGSETIDRFLKETSEQISETLFTNSPKNVGIINDEYREVCLSMPDLSEGDQEIMLGKNAYILENGNIVEPQENSANVVVYVLNEKNT